MDAPAPRDEPKGTLWLLVAAPTVWILVFVLVYATVAVACARGTGATVGAARSVAFVVSGAAVVAMAAIGVIGWKRIPGREEDVAAEGAARERFVGWTTVLLAGLSVVATAYLVLNLAAFEACR